MKNLQVLLGPRSYSIHVGTAILELAPRLVGSRLGDVPPVIVSNRTVMRLHGERLLTATERQWPKPAIVEIGDGERFKNHDSLLRIYRAMFRARADRRSWILALGGGVVGDVAGFAAATFMRGIPLVSAPTTLLAQVDSSVGGKVGINVPEGKNLIGAFHQPTVVVSDVDTLATLPDRELAAGLFEIVKTAAIGSEDLMEYLERKLSAVLKRQRRCLEHAVIESCRVKAGVVSQDEREQNLRMILNFGHTVGHALEAATEYRRFKHGEAVGWGMLAALALGRELGRTDEADALRLARLIARVAPLPPLRGIPVARVQSALFRDKKFTSGGIRMVFLRGIGRCEVVSGIDRDLIRSFLASFLTTPEASFAPGSLR